MFGNFLILLNCRPGAHIELHVEQPAEGVHPGLLQLQLLLRLRRVLLLRGGRAHPRLLPRRARDHGRLQGGHRSAAGGRHGRHLIPGESAQIKSHSSQILLTLLLLK